MSTPTQPKPSTEIQLRTLDELNKYLENKHNTRTLKVVCIKCLNSPTSLREVDTITLNYYNITYKNAVVPKADLNSKPNDRKKKPNGMNTKPNGINNTSTESDNKVYYEVFKITGDDGFFVAVESSDLQNFVLVKKIPNTTNKVILYEGDVYLTPSTPKQSGFFSKAFNNLFSSNPLTPGGKRKKTKRSLRRRRSKSTMRRRRS
jgi:hypothetical protein